MKNIKSYIIIFTVAILAIGCSDEYFETRPSDFISGSDIEKESELRPELQIANLKGLYTLMFNTYTGGTTGHDDFGHKGYDLFTDLLVGDMVLAGYTYGWYQGFAEYTWLGNPANNRNYTPWRYYYRMIMGANTIIDGLGGDEAVLEDDSAKHIMGQAKTMRAFAYFYLMNLYGQGNYNTHASLPSIPVYTSIAQPAQPLSTGKEVYDLILDDLNEAVSLLETFTRTGVHEVNQNVAKAYLAYAYAAVNDYPKVQEITNDIIGTSGYSLTPASKLVGELDGNDVALAGFNDVDKYSESWMWGTDLTLEHKLGLASWWGQVDLFTYSYAWAGDPKTVNYDLYSQLPETDIRRGQFMAYTAANQLIPGNKFYYTEGRRTLTTGAQGDVTTDYLYLRIEEMYLLNAEAAAKNGDYGTAKQRLSELLEIRMPEDHQDYITSISDSELQDEIYFQTRIELWGEGKSYLAFKRLGKSQELPSNHLTSRFRGDVISYDQERMSFKIPEAETLNNPNL